MKGSCSGFEALARRIVVPEEPGGSYDNPTLVLLRLVGILD
jgi:hypothetical protein